MAQEIKNILPTLFAKTDNWKLTLLSKWNFIMGEIGTKVYLEKICEGTLVLGVNDSCWLQELHILSNVIIDNINKHLDQPRIKQLYFKKVSIKPIKKITQKKYKKSYHAQYRLNPQEEVALEQIKDQNLKEALYNFLLRCHREI